MTGNGSNGEAYLRMRGTSWGLAGSFRAYLGEDHLLELTSRTFVETYRRFYFSEIRSFSIEKTWRFAVYNGILVTWIIILFQVLLVLGLGGGRSALLAAGPAGVLILVNVLRGPTCRCRVATGVQSVELGPFRRERAARRARDVIADRIAAFQGSRLSPEDVCERVALREPAESEKPGERPAPRGVRPAAAMPPPDAMPAIPAGTLLLHDALGGVWLLLALVLSIDFSVQATFVTAMSALLLIAVLCVSSGAAFRPLPELAAARPVRAIAWTGLAGSGLLFGLGTILYFSVIFSSPGLAADEYAIFRSLAGIDPMENRLALAFYGIGAVGGALLGGVGLYYARRCRRDLTILGRSATEDGS